MTTHKHAQEPESPSSYSKTHVYWHVVAACDNMVYAFTLSNAAVSVTLKHKADLQIAKIAISEKL